MRTKNPNNKRRTDGKQAAMISTIRQRRHDPVFRRANRQSLLNRNRLPTISIVCWPSFQQTTTSHRIPQSIGLFFVMPVSLGVSRYFLLTCFCSHGSEMPVTLETPANGIFSSSSLSTISHISAGIVLFWGFSTNCLPQSLQRYFCLPLWMDPFLTKFCESHAGHSIFPSLFLMVLFEGTTDRGKCLAQS